MQHAVRAFTPKDAKALKAAVQTFPITDHYPTWRRPAVARSVKPPSPCSTSARAHAGGPTASIRRLPGWSAHAEERTAVISASPLAPKYGQRVNRESAEEILSARLDGDRLAVDEAIQRAEPAPERPQQPRDDDSLAEQFGEVLQSPLAREVVRGIFGMLRPKRRRRR